MAASDLIRDYQVWVVLPDGDRRVAADFRLETDARGRHRRSALRYTGEWLAASRSYALNPVQAPLAAAAREWETEWVPAVLDEVLPGRWERAVRQRLWGRRADVDDLHAVLAAVGGSWRVGAVEIVPAGLEPPPLASPLCFADLAELSEEAERTWQHRTPEVEALRRMQGGSSVGGARPKVLVEDQGAWLVKFNRSDDAFNHARVEAACLMLAARAGIPVPETRRVGAGRFEALAVKRFDVTDRGGRLGLLSANALLCDGANQAPVPHPRYDDLVGIIRHHGSSPGRDLAQLYAQMLFNQAINNRDDHLKNFSFLQDCDRFELSPAYDLVPSEALGAYPQLGLGNSNILPTPGSDEAVQAGRNFMLAPAEAGRINEAICLALAQLEEVMDVAELSDEDRRFLRQRVRGA